MLPPLDTTLILSETVADKVVNYTSFMKGRSQFGIRVAIPQILHQQYTPPTGTELECTYVAGQKLYAFQTLILGYESGNLPYMVLQEPGEIRESNRQDCYRIPMHLALSYVIKGKGQGEHSTTVDISTGGLSMYTAGLRTRGMTIALNLELPRQMIFLEGRIVWSAYKGRYAVTGVEFEQVNPFVEKVLHNFLKKAEHQLRPGAHSIDYILRGEASRHNVNG